MWTLPGRPNSTYLHDQVPSFEKEPTPAMSTSTPIVAATDGSALRNPSGPAGWSWYVNDSCWSAGGWKSNTNNVAELTAVLEVLHATPPEQPLTIQTDSQYAINCVTKWAHGWKRNGWIKNDKTPVKNVEIIKEIFELLQDRSVSFVWVKGHSGHPNNEAADLRAHNAATALDAGQQIDRGPGYKL